MHDPAGRLGTPPELLPSVDTTGSALQGITNPTDGTANPFAAARSLWNAALRTALIEVDGQPAGTGVLIGEDLLLTAYHVIWPDSAAATRVPTITAVFDYSEESSRSPAETGVKVPVVEVIMHSPPTPEERGVTEPETGPLTTGAGAATTYLDFAVLRLASHPRSGSDPNGHAAFRGYYPLDPSEYDLVAAELSIVHHPLGGSVQSSRLLVPTWNQARTRIRYDSNTTYGSSGAPIVDHRGRLVAIHHYYGNRRNQGIPFSAISRLLRSSPHADLFPDSVARPGAEHLPPVRSRIDCQPFEPLDEWSSAFGDEGTARYIPTRQEYLRGEIQVRGDLVQQVDTRLSSGVCLLQGRGTVGKTTLTLFVGLRHDSAGGTTYYLDLADETIDQPAIEVLNSLSALANASTMFIVDNVHTNERLAYALYRHWQRHGAGSRLLLAGRLVTRTTRASIEGTGLARLEPDAITIEVTEDDLLLTYQRLVRINGLDDGRPAPSSSTVAGWLALFGGDRIAFVAAVRRHLEGRAPRQWLANGCPLTESDAVSHIKEQYLDPYPEATQALIQLAAASTIEITLPEELVPPGILRSLMAAGIVHTTTHGRDAYRRYTLAHAGLGHLIVKAARISSGSSVLGDLSMQSPAFGFAVVQRMERLGRQDEADPILRGLASDMQLIARSLCRTASSRSILSMLAEQNMLTYEQLDEGLTAIEVPSVLLDSVALDLGGTKELLKFLERRMPKYYQQFRTRLAEPDWCERIADSMPYDLGNATSLLRYTVGGLPDVAAAISALLADPDRCARIADAVPNGLGNATSFLRYAVGGLPEVAAALPALLAGPDRAERIADAVPNDLGNAAEFLRYAANALPDVAAALPALLADPDRAERIAEAVPNELGNATIFLRYAGDALPDLAAALPGLLADPDRCERIADAVPNELGHATSFFRYAVNALPEVAAAISVLRADPDRCKRIADAVPNDLGNATSFLRYGIDALPDVAAALPALLADPDRAERIAGAVPNGLGNATSFLRYAIGGLSDVAATLPALLADPDRCERIADAVPNDLGHAADFHRYAVDALPAVAAAISTLLADPDRCVQIADAVPNQLGNAASFLRYADDALPDVAAALPALLADSDRCERIADAVPNDLGNAAEFLRYAVDALPEVAAAVAALLADPDRSERIADAAPNQLGHAANFIEFTLAHEFRVADVLVSLLGDERRCAAISNAVTNDVGHAAQFLEMAHRGMPVVAARLAVLLAKGEMAVRIADMASSNIESMLTFMQFCFAQMPAVAEGVITELVVPRRVSALAERAGRGHRERWALFRLVELADLHHAELVQPLWALIDEDEIS